MNATLINISDNNMEAVQISNIYKNKWFCPNCSRMYSSSISSGI